MPLWVLWLTALLVAAVIAAFVFATRRRLQTVERRAEPVTPTAPKWTAAAGEEFADLSEAERCDLVFALAALDDVPSLLLLERALDDPSESVAIAAARAIARRGGGALQRYFEANPGQRSARIAEVLELLG
jgi:hypothetical protein